MLGTLTVEAIPMYIIVTMLMLLRGFTDTILIPIQQALSSTGKPGFLPDHYYAHIFTEHGLIMIFCSNTFSDGLNEFGNAIID